MRYLCIRSAIAIVVLAGMGAFQPSQALPIFDYDNAGAWSHAARKYVYNSSGPFESIRLRETLNGFELLWTFNYGSDSNGSCGFMSALSCQESIDRYDSGDRPGTVGGFDRLSGGGFTRFDTPLTLSTCLFLDR